jgi:hypothetical protein
VIRNHESCYGYSVHLISSVGNFVNVECNRSVKIYAIELKYREKKCSL